MTDTFAHAREAGAEPGAVGWGAGPVGEGARLRRGVGSGG